MKHTVLITGSNRGIGLEFCRQLKQKEFQVIATCRQPSKALKALKVEIIANIDVSDQKSLLRLTNILSGRQLDWLINNAGIANNIAISDLDESNIASCKRSRKITSY